MLSLPLVQQKSLFQGLVEIGAFQALNQNSVILDFVSRIWDIDLLSSTDSRFSTLRGDIQQHYINNSDWDEHYLFSEVLKVYRDKEKFQKLIELIPSDEFQNDQSLVEKLLREINSYLIPYEQRLVARTKHGIIVYEVQSCAAVDEVLPSNTIPFIVERRSNKQGDHGEPTEFPCFVLAADTWNDFGVRSKFRLFYYSGKGSRKLIGAIKVITHVEKENEWDLIDIKEKLHDSFTELSLEFCSLGQENSYYENLKSVLPDKYRSVLWALKDCAIFSVVEESFERDILFRKSLLRSNVAERLVRDAKFLIEGIKVQNRESFKYHFKVPFSEDEVLLDVEFDSSSILPSRLLAVVGKNGAGKTQMLSCLPIDLAKKKQEAFEPQLPLYSKIVSVSTSPHDHCFYPDKSNDFNYEYIGLTTKEGNKRTIITDEEIEDKLKDACGLVNEKDRVSSLRRILEKILPDSVIKEIFYSPDGADSLDFKILSEVRQRLSSGESTLLYILICVVSTLRYDTLLLFDEPETHLHPNAISALISALYKLLEEFESYAIVVTHSPLVIREVKSKHVRIMERFEGAPVIRKTQQETLGANISELVDEIFGNKDIPLYYREIISQLARGGASEGEIYRSIADDNRALLPIGLQVFVKSVCANNEES